jgi:hypothetical protein
MLVCLSMALPVDEALLRLDDAAILRRYGIEPDPVIEAYKVHVDRTLLRQT